jgi:hypothetical protein
MMTPKQKVSSLINPQGQCTIDNMIVLAEMLNSDEISLSDIVMCERGSFDLAQEVFLVQSGMQYVRKLQESYENASNVGEVHS